MQEFNWALSSIVSIYGFGEEEDLMDPNSTQTVPQLNFS